MEKNLGHRKIMWSSREDPQRVRTSQNSHPGKRLYTWMPLHYANCLFISTATATPVPPKHKTRAHSICRVLLSCAPRHRDSPRVGKGPRFITCLCRSWVGRLGESRVQRLELSLCHLSEPAHLWALSRNLIGGRAGRINFLSLFFCTSAPTMLSLNIISQRNKGILWSLFSRLCGQKDSNKCVLCIS